VSSTSDPLAGAGIGLASIATGAAAGGLLVSLVLAAAYGLPRGPDSLFATLTLAGATGALVLAAAVAFTAARPLGTWKGLLTAMVAIAGAALASLLTMVADQAGGRAGLVLLAAVCGAIMVLAIRFRRRALGAAR
jgi:hypothetical protein